MPVDAEAYKDYKFFLEQLADIEAQLANSPNEPALLELKKEILDGIDIIEDALPELKEDRLKPKSKPSNEGVKNHNAADEGHGASSGHHRVFASGDIVQARRRGEPFTPAVVLSVLGPPSNPNYVVRFKADRSTITAPSYDVRPAVAPQAMDGRKRKVDDDEAAAPASPSKPANVISAPAALNPEFLKQQESATPKSLDETGNGKKKRKLGSGKKLEESRSTWQAFQGNMSKKLKPKESIFRTGEGLNSRVGVIGSGKGMRKDQKRQKNEYSRLDEDEAED